MKWQGSSPLLLLMGAYVCGGIGMAVLESVGAAPLIGTPRWTLDAYVHVLTAEWLVDGMWLTMRIALVSTGIAVGCAVMICMCIGHFALTRTLLLIPLAVPHLVAALLTVWIAGQSGWGARMAHALGIVDHWSDVPILTNDTFGWGIIFAYVWKEVPFIVLFWLPIVVRIREEWVRVARVHGASAWRAWWGVVWPLSWPSLAIGSGIVCVFVIGAIEVPYVLGVTHPASLSVLSFELYRGTLVERPQAIVVALCQMLMCLVVLAIVLFCIWRRGQRHAGW
ncbi:MAG: ABC transporter permease subunit [Paenibacillaceae bacterium]|nr:ABC transporter permease subunit [Paenibacillaceae bacterium]